MHNGNGMLRGDCETYPGLPIRRIINCLLLSDGVGSVGFMLVELSMALR